MRDRTCIFLSFLKVYIKDGWSFYIGIPSKQGESRVLTEPSVAETPKCRRIPCLLPFFFFLNRHSFGDEFITHEGVPYIYLLDWLPNSLLLFKGWVALSNPDSRYTIFWMEPPSGWIAQVMALLLFLLMRLDLPFPSQSTKGISNNKWQGAVSILLGRHGIQDFM